MLPGTVPGAGLAELRRDSMRTSIVLALIVTAICWPSFSRHLW